MYSLFKNKVVTFIWILVLCLAIVFIANEVFSAEPFRVKLNLFERLVVMGLLPQTGNFATLKIVTEANLMLGATDEESVLAGLESTPEGGVVARLGWLAVPEKEFTFKETLLKLIKDALTELNEADPPKLTMEHFRVYEKFMLVEEKEEE